MTMNRAWQAVLVAVVCSCGLSPTRATAGDDTRVVIWYDREDGSAFLKNNSLDDTYVLDGYTIGSDFADLLPGDYDGAKGWKALEDIESQFPGDIATVTAQLGPAALDFGSANPGAGNLSELTLNIAGITFSPGEMWFIGKPFSNVPINDAGQSKDGYFFLFKTTDNAQLPVSTIVGAPVPEPSTGLLALLAGLGLFASGRRPALRAVRAR